MKVIKIIFCSALCLILSCKKDTGKIDCWFNLNPPDIYRDSISSIAISYSDYSDFNYEDDLLKPDLYKYSIKTNSKRSNCDIYPCSIDYGYINLEVGHWYVIKKFDLVDSFGKILFDLPWKPDSLHGATNIPYLPHVFKANGRIFFDFSKFDKSIK